MRAFVTGGTGFIGRHLVRRLTSEGMQVRCLVRATAARDTLQQLGADLVTGDLSAVEPLREQLRDCQVVFHLAGKTSALHASELNEVNALGTHRLLQACADQPVPPRVVLVSSLAAAGTSARRKWRRGDEPARPISYYGRSKRGGERAAMRFTDRLRISVIRPGIVFGEENRETLPIFHSICRFRVHAVPTFFPKRVALIHQEDLIDLISVVAERGASLSASNGRSEQGYYFAADPHCPTYVEWGRMVARCAEQPPPYILMVPEMFLWPAAAVAQLAQRQRGVSASFNLDKIREATAGDWVCRAQFGYQQLGFQHRHSLQQRTRQTIAWYRAQGWI